MKILAEANHYTNRYGVFKLYVVQSDFWPGEHVVLIKGSIEKQENIACRIQSHCLPGITLDSADCDCKYQLNYALSFIEKEKLGILIYLDQEGRGHGLVTKIQALNNKNSGMDTFKAVESLGLKDDIRNYDAAIEILRHFSPQSIRFLTNNPSKIDSLSKSGINIKAVINLPIYTNQRLSRHLKAKKAKGHFINIDEDS